MHRGAFRAAAACAGGLLLAGCVGARGGRVPTILGFDDISWAAVARGVEPAPEVRARTLGYDPLVADGFIRWHECTTKDTCGRVEHTRRVTDLVSVTRVGQADVDGRRVEVFALDFSAPPAPLSR